MIHQALKFLTGLLFLDVIAVYGYCLGKKNLYPPSHPWSGITLVLLSFSLFFQLREGESASALKRNGLIIAVAFSTVAGCLWTISALLLK